MFMRAVHPGAVLKDELEELGVTPTEFARRIAVPLGRVGRIIAGRRGASGDAAVRVGPWFGTEPLVWLNVQALGDLARAERATGEAVRRLPTRAAQGARLAHHGAGG